MNNSQNIKTIINEMSKLNFTNASVSDTAREKAVFEILDIKDIEKIISELDEDKKAKLIEIMKKIK